MVFAHARFTVVSMGSVLLVSMLGCVRPKPENQVMRLGDDVLASGSAPSLGYDSIPGDAILAGGDINFSGSTGGLTGWGAMWQAPQATPTRYGLTSLLLL